MTEFQQSNVKASKLGISEVQEIRRLYNAGMTTQGALSRKFSVSVIQIGRIVRGEVWQKIPSFSPKLSEGELKDSAERMYALQQARLESPELAALAAEFLSFDSTVAATRQAPRSPLEGGEGDDGIAPTGLSQLEQHARDYGLDIDKLRQAGAT